MREILQTCESPDKTYSIKLKRKFSIFDIATGETHDSFYLTIKNKSSLLNKLFPRKVKLGESHYVPIITPSGHPLGGNRINQISLNPKEDHIETIISRRTFNKYSGHSSYKETMNINYSKR